jgi:hypothetical protein
MRRHRTDNATIAIFDDHKGAEGALKKRTAGGFAVKQHAGARDIIAIPA